MTLVTRPLKSATVEKELFASGMWVKEQRGLYTRPGRHRTQKSMSNGNFFL